MNGIRTAHRPITPSVKMIADAFSVNKATMAGKNTIMHVTNHTKIRKPPIFHVNPNLRCVKYNISTNKKMATGIIGKFPYAYSAQIIANKPKGVFINAHL